MKVQYDYDVDAIYITFTVVTIVASHMSIENMRIRTIPPTHPGVMLREDFLPDFGLTATALAQALGVSRQTVSELLRERRKLATTDEDNFNVLDTKQLGETLSGTTKVMTTLLGAVAAVSLLVGGIGIMNIMLVSVTERTREIGLRLAIGALEREVLLQFLIEAVVLAALGGVIGIVLATGASIGLSRFMEVPFVFNPGVNLLSFVFSAGIGVLFGYFPARRAARLDPIEALRHE